MTQREGSVSAGMATVPRAAMPRQHACLCCCRSVDFCTTAKSRDAYAYFYLHHKNNFARARALELAARLPERVWRALPHPMRVAAATCAIQRVLQFNELSGRRDELSGTSGVERGVGAARAVLRAGWQGTVCLQVDELAHSVLEQLLCHPSCAVPSLSHPDVPPRPPTLREFARDSLSTIRCEVLVAGSVGAGAAHNLADRVAASLQRAAEACAPEAAAASRGADGGASPATQHAGDSVRPDRVARVNGRNGRRRGAHGAGGGRGPAGRGSGLRLLAQRGVKLPQGCDALFRCEVAMPRQAQSACIAYFQVHPLPHPCLTSTPPWLPAATLHDVYTHVIHA